MTGTALAALLAAYPDHAKDLRLNLESVLGESSLSPAQRLGTALACAAAVRCEPLRAALKDEATAQVGEPVVQDALAVAGLMGMNNVFYRFRHLVEKEAYSQFPARLRMSRLAKPAANRADCELFALAVSAVNACGTCVQAHEQELRKAGFSEAQIHDAVRIAAVIAGSAVALS